MANKPYGNIYQNKQNVSIKVTDIYNIYPIGSIYMSVNSTNPSNFFGGTWEQIKDRFLLACGSSYSNGSTGGEASHKLTIAEMPSHKHNSSKTIAYDAGVIGQWGSPIYNTEGSYTGVYGWLQNLMDNTGGNQAHNNMPPYVAVYVWKRVS